MGARDLGLNAGFSVTPVPKVARERREVLGE